jgi:hypothetical protein
MNWLKKNKIIIGILLVGILTIGAYKTIYKPHKQISQEQPSFVGTASEFSNQMDSKENLWLTKVVQIKGTVTELSEMDLVLNHSLFCQFDKSTSSKEIQVNDEVTVKGRFIGYDDLLEEIKIDKCTIITPNN